MWDIQERTLLKCELLTANMTRRTRRRGARGAPLAFIRIKMLEEYESREWIGLWVVCLSDRSKRRHSTQHNNLRRNESLSSWHEIRYVLYSWSFSKILPSACPCYHPLPSKHPLFATPASNARILNEKEESIGLLRQTLHPRLKDRNIRVVGRQSMVYFSWRWLGAESCSCWVHHQLRENPNLTSILSIYPFAFPNPDPDSTYNLFGCVWVVGHWYPAASLNLYP